MGLSINMFDLTFSPDVITELLGIQPTTQGKKGEHAVRKIKGKIVKSRLILKHNYWVLKSHEPEEESDVELQWSALRKIIIPKQEILRELGKLHNVFFSVAIYGASERPAIFFPKDMVHFASDINADIDVDLLC